MKLRCGRRPIDEGRGREIKAIVVGAAGRMGSRVIHAIEETPSIRLCRAIERPDHPSLGKDIGELHRAGKDGDSSRRRLEERGRGCDHQLQQPEGLAGEPGVRP